MSVNDNTRLFHRRAELQSSTPRLLLLLPSIHILLLSLLPASVFPQPLAPPPLQSPSLVGHLHRHLYLTLTWTGARVSSRLIFPSRLRGSGGDALQLQRGPLQKHHRPPAMCVSVPVCWKSLVLRIPNCSGLPLESNEWLCLLFLTLIHSSGRDIDVVGLLITVLLLV